MTFPIIPYRIMCLYSQESSAAKVIENDKGKKKLWRHGGDMRLWLRCDRYIILTRHNVSRVIHLSEESIHKERNRKIQV